ncbi:MAG TPA: radical SAM protein [Polyangiaceae bacterium]|nr:radical SAM protein [Polyangiaceae bacterium]
MPTARTLELALDYRCNLRCIGCRACEDRGERIAPERAAALLREAREAGATCAWLGGGEPTLREDLPALVRRARALGFDEVVVQTNAMRLAYPAYAGALVSAGVTEVRVNAKSARAEVHDRLSGETGAHALLLRALENLGPLGVRVTADVLLARSTAPHLDETLAFFADRGVRRFALWLLYSSDVHDGREGESEVPRIADVVPAFERAHAIARSRGLELVSFHTPPCTLPPALRTTWQPARDLGIEVVDPGGHRFALHASPFEGAGHVEGCAGCAFRDRCGGPRADYLRLHGAGEFRALSSAEEGP